MPPRKPRATALACLLSLAALPSLALADPGVMVRMDITGSVQMTDPPMSMATPPISKEVCTPKVYDLRQVMSQSGRNKNCSFSAYKESGSNVAYHFACDSGRGSIQGNASFMHDAGGSFHGSTHATMNMGGHAGSVDATYKGTPTGATCDYTPPKTS